MLIGVYDERGKPRIDPRQRNDVGHGMWLTRELVLKDDLRSGQFGIISDVAGGVWFDSIRFNVLSTRR